MKWPFVTCRRLDRELDAVKADRDRLRRERDQFAEDRNAHRVAARTAAEKYTDAATVNDCLTQQVTALTEQLAATAGDWPAKYEAEKSRADRLQAQYDDAVGLTDPRVEDGKYWQRTRHDKKGVAL